MRQYASARSWFYVLSGGVRRRQVARLAGCFLPALSTRSTSCRMDARCEQCGTREANSRHLNCQRWRLDSMELGAARAALISLTGFLALGRCPKLLGPGADHPDRTRPGVLARNPSGEAPLLRIMGKPAIPCSDGPGDGRKRQPQGAETQPRTGHDRPPRAAP